MTNERYLKYLALNTILMDYMYMCDYSKNKSECEIYLADNQPVKINAKKLRADVIELQKEFLEPYVIESDSKE